MISVITYQSRWRRLLEWWDQPKFMYAALGRTTPWDNYRTQDAEGNSVEYNEVNMAFIPPTPSIETEQVEEFIAAKRIMQRWYVKPYQNPSQEEMDNGIYYKGQYYEYTTDRDYAREHKFASIMMYVEFFGDEVPLETYRQIGIYTQVDTNAAILQQYDWSKLSTERKGQLEIISHSKPITRDEMTSQQYFILIDF